jgi:hypothetical protein
MDGKRHDSIHWWRYKSLWLYGYVLGNPVSGVLDALGLYVSASAPAYEKKLHNISL